MSPLLIEGKGKRVRQVYQVVAFTDIPSNARGPCELKLGFPAGYPIYVEGGSAPQMNVYTLFSSSPNSISASNQWSWNLLANGGMDKGGLWGVVQATAPSSATINSKARYLLFRLRRTLCRLDADIH